MNGYDPVRPFRIIARDWSKVAPMAACFGMGMLGAGIDMMALVLVVYVAAYETGARHTRATIEREMRVLGQPPL